jgi:thioester reductase-like protein
MNARAALQADNSRLASVIATVAARLSGTGADLDPAVPFAALGLDSLGSVELAALLEDELGTEIPVDLFAECPDAQTLADRLMERPADVPRVDLRTMMRQDATLPADILPPAAMRVRSDGRKSFGLLDADRILLTGATGFLGGWLAARLLARSDATLICLARGGGGKSAEDRIRGSLDARGVDATGAARRVRVVDGDLSLPQLGLSTAAFAHLAREVDAICHAGAVVNWVQSYRTMRASNVLGTRELLRLASMHGRPFHFVSSLGVCYSSDGPRRVDESFAPLPHIDGIHLGYAQTKVVAETLVAEAARRGLPATIYRPSLIAGHSTTGDFNSDDLLSLLVKGCVRMRCAPDLDWTLDALPVDIVVDALLQLSTAEGTFHLLHPRPRHWRECVLWMRLYGYPLTLLPYRAWLERLRRDLASARATGARHPLQPLEPLLFDAPEGTRGLTIPELYEDSRRAKAERIRTARALGDDRPCPDLDASLLERYFQTFISAGHLPAPDDDQPRTSTSRVTFDADFFSRALSQQPGVAVRDAILVESGSPDSIVGELTAWRSAQRTGLFRYALELEERDSRLLRHVVLKVKARDTDAVAVAEGLGALCDERIGIACQRWRDRLGMAGSHRRELAVYQQADDRFRRHSPALLGSIEDEGAGLWALVLERVDDAADLPDAWPPEAVGAAIAGLAALQSIWYRREAELAAQPWIGWIQSASSASEMSDLWTALANHARPFFSRWSDPSLPSIHLSLIGGIARWWRVLESQPPTLIHNDFNPRNICLRPGEAGPVLCAYDWELATRGAPQRDLAELLCFVLPASADDAQIDHWIERHRTALEAETGVSIDRRRWEEGFAAALYDVLVSRLSFYTLINSIRLQPFLPRVVQTWRRLYERFPLEDAS